MKLKHRQKKGVRFFKQFYAMAIDAGWDVIGTYTFGYKSLARQGAWMTRAEAGDLNYNSSSHAPCRSVRAFRRKLRKLSGVVPPQTQFVLISRWRDVVVTGRVK